MMMLDVKPATVHTESTIRIDFFIMLHHALSPPLQAWLDRGQFRSLGQHSIFTLDEGEPEQAVLLVIHGFPTASWDFNRIWPGLRERFRVITLDMLGFGFSDKPNQRDYTIHKQADLFTALIEQLEINEYHLLAHDYGVSVAQELLARQFNGQLASACLSCCFLNGGLFPETHRALLIQRILLSPLGRYVNALLGFSVFKTSFSRVFGESTQPSEAELEQFWQLIAFKEGRHLFHNLITYMNDRREHRERWLQPLQNSAIPLALINGSVDPVSGSHLVVRYKQLGCRLDALCELTDIGHYPQYEAPQRVLEAYSEFIDTCMK